MPSYMKTCKTFFPCFSDTKGLGFYSKIGSTISSIKSTAKIHRNSCLKVNTIFHQLENIIKFPVEVGLSGKAASKKEVVKNKQGESDPLFSSEVDNIYGMGKIENMLIGPMIDQKGEVQGVVQLINKKGRNKIPQTDEVSPSLN